MTARSEAWFSALPRIAADALSRGVRNPFSIWVSLKRNPIRTVPMMVVTLAASLGIAAVVVLSDSLIRTALAPNDFLVGGLVVRGDGAALDQVDVFVRDRAPSAVTTRLGPPTFIRGRIFALDSYFPVLFVSDNGAAPLLAQYGDHLQSGRLPSPGSLEIVVPEGFAKSRGVGLGDTVGGPNDYTPLSLRIVGLVSGPRWIAIGSATGVRAAGGDTAQAILIHEPDEAVRGTLETGVRDRFRSAVTVQHWTPREDAKEEAPYQDDLRLMLTFIIVINSIVLSTIGGLLALLYFRQRQAEFLLLSILGRTKLELARRATGEIAIVVGTGWLAGLAAAWVLMNLLQDLVFSQRAIILDLSDPAPIFYTLPLALTTIGVSGAVIAISVIQFDPVARLQARA